MSLDMIDARPLYKCRFAWDIGPHNKMPELLSALGLVPPSPEAIEAEHADSHIRLKMIEPWEPVIDWLSQIAAEVVTCLMIDKPGLGDDDDEEGEAQPLSVSDEEREEMTQNYADMISVCTKAILASMLYDGRTGRGIKFVE